MNRTKIGLGLLRAFALFGAIGSLYLLFQGHRVTGVSHQFPWGIFISTYVFFALIGSGICLVSSLGSIFRLQPFQSIVKCSVVLAVLTLSAAFLIMGLETPQPLNMIYMLFSPNFSSGIFWMGSLYAVYFVFLIGESWHMLIKNNQRQAHRFGIFAFITALAASSNLGAIFGFIHARPFWEGAYMPIFFVITALLSGSAALILLYYYKEGRQSDSPVIPALSKLLVLFLVITAVAIAWKVITGLYGNIPGRFEAYQALLIGPYAFNFWGLEVGVGIVAPLFLLLTQKNRSAACAAAGFSLLGLFFMRYDMVMVGQIVPLEVLDRFPRSAAYLVYSPTWVELAGVCLGLGFIGLTYRLAEKRLDLGADDERSGTPKKITDVAACGS